MATPITPNMTINEAIALYPPSMKIFSKYGLDTCCGGHQEIAAAAKQNGADLDGLLRELEEAFGREKR